MLEWPSSSARLTLRGQRRLLARLPKAGACLNEFCIIGRDQVWTYLQLFPSLTQPGYLAIEEQPIAVGKLQFLSELACPHIWTNSSSKPQIWRRAQLEMQFSVPVTDSLLI